MGTNTKPSLSCTRKERVNRIRLLLGLHWRETAASKEENKQQQKDHGCIRCLIRTTIASTNHFRWDAAESLDTNRSHFFPTILVRRARYIRALVPFTHFWFRALCICQTETVGGIDTTLTTVASHTVWAFCTQARIVFTNTCFGVTYLMLCTRRCQGIAFIRYTNTIHTQLASVLASDTIARIAEYVRNFRN